MAGRPSRAKQILEAFGLLLLAAVIYVGWRFGPAAYDLARAGFFSEAFSSRELRKYQGTSIDNLKAMHLALSMYQESEGQFPLAEGWMDALRPYLRTDDMSEEEAKKKLISPLIKGAKAGTFGYAMNDAASGKYKEDIPDPAKTPLIFDSSDTGWNAHGKPEELLPKPPRQGGNLGISVSGEILKF